MKKVYLIKMIKNSFKRVIVAKNICSGQKTYNSTTHFFSLISRSKIIFIIFIRGLTLIQKTINTATVDRVQVTTKDIFFFLTLLFKNYYYYFLQKS